MRRSTPLKRTGFKPKPHRVADPQSRDERIAERAARILATATPRKAAMHRAESAVSPIMKDKPLRSERYRRAVASLPCAFCGIEGFSQHAHENDGKGARMKVDDRRAMPLCCDRPSIVGCHSRFDRYELIPGGRAAHVALGDELSKKTRITINAAGLWPAGVPQLNPGEDA